MQNLPPANSNLPNPLRKLVAVIATASLIGLTLMFSVIVFSVILVVGTIGWIYLWWKTRELRKQMRNFPPRDGMRQSTSAEADVVKGEIIEGEVIHVPDAPDVNEVVSKRTTP